jgi:hypothetical protein
MAADNYNRRGGRARGRGRGRPPGLRGKEIGVFTSKTNTL